MYENGGCKFQVDGQAVREVFILHTDGNKYHIQKRVRLCTFLDSWDFKTSKFDKIRVQNVCFANYNSNQKIPCTNFE